MSEKRSDTTYPPIDVVITWVDGSDPRLAEKRNQYLSSKDAAVHPGATSTRFASNNEIKYCVLSIFKFAPFIRNVYIVTDGQQPDIFDEVSAHFPHRLNSIKIVDHKDIFKGYEQYLPTFNSTSIETMIWRIEGLSENFVYFNDDVILIRKVKPDDWVKNGRPVLRGNWRFFPLKKIFNQHIRLLINKKILAKKDYHPKLSFYIRQWQAAKILGYKFKYFFHCHTPHVLNRVSLETFYKKNPQLLENNIKYRFRSDKQFISISLANHLEIKQGNTQVEKLNLGYFHPYYSSRQISRKIIRCNTDPKIKSVCLQSLDMLQKKEQAKILGWINILFQMQVEETAKAQLVNW
jgi:hypothetical protein